jgi:type IV pilus assembly protein PilY1
MLPHECLDRAPTCSDGTPRNPLLVTIYVALGLTGAVGCPAARAYDGEVIRAAACGSASFSAPTVAANPSNRTRHSNDLYVSVFERSATGRVSSDVRRHRLMPTGKIVADADSLARAGSTAPSTELGFPSDTATKPDPRPDIVDPSPARPAIVVYGGIAEAPDTTVFAVTNDGMVRAIDARTGAELWTYAPIQLLPQRRSPHEDAGVSNRPDGLDGSVSAYKIDVDQDGVVEPTDGDRVLLYGMRRGGSHVYALDVTDRAAPKLLWRAGAEDDPAQGLGTITTASPRHLPGIGQTWSSPTITRMNIDRSWSADNPRKLVAVFGGGYDPSHDSKTAYADDTVGNRVYIVDAITGHLIWHAGPTTDAGAQLKLSRMTSAIPGSVRSFDLTGDGFDDRMYAADLGGRIWRFDITTGAAPASLFQGGVFASLGVADSGGTPDSANRKFFYAPDASLIRYGGRSWINIAIGSGDRERPVSNTAVDNRFFSLRDYNIFNAVPSDKYLSDCSSEITGPCHQVITADDSRLTNLTTDLNATLGASTVGWYLNLVEQGEKALAESRTFQNAVYFTTYVPRERNQSVTCGIAVGVSKLFVVSAINADPIFNFDLATEGVTALTDRSKDLAQGAIAPEVVFVFPTPENQVPGVTPPAVPPICLVGLEGCGAGLANPPVRTYWRQRGAN